MTNTRIPSLTPPPETTPIRTQADLHNHWTRLMGPLGFSRRQLWLNILGCDGRPTAFLTQLTDLPPLPDEPLLAGVMDITRQLLAMQAVDGSLALLLARPGPDRRTASDLAWAEALTVSAAHNDVPLRPIYVATDVAVGVISPDDLLTVSA